MVTSTHTSFSLGHLSLWGIPQPTNAVPWLWLSGVSNTRPGVHISQGATVGRLAMVRVRIKTQIEADMDLWEQVFTKNLLSVKDYYILMEEKIILPETTSEQGDIQPF